MLQSYNLRSPSVKRILKEAQELRDATYEYAAKPLDDNIYEWHFTFRGPEGTEFEGGIYHGRIILPHEYPMKPPNIILLNPNGRFQLHKKICLSISGYHPETWQPSWSIRTALLAIRGFMETKSNGSIGGLDYPKQERKKLAKKSLTFSCETCGKIQELLLAEKPEQTSASEQVEKEQKELMKQIEIGKKPEEKKETEKKEVKDPEKVETPTTPSAGDEVSTDPIKVDDVAAVLADEETTQVVEELVETVSHQQTDAVDHGVTETQQDEVQTSAPEVVVAANVEESSWIDTMLQLAIVCILQLICYLFWRRYTITFYDE